MRAAVYCRISSDKEGKRLGVDRQRDDCTALVERNGWTVAGMYIDNDISAARLPGQREKVRPEYDRMVADIKARKIDAVVAYSQSRLSRKGTIEDFIDLCEANDIKAVAIVTGADINPGGNLVTARVQAAVDAEYVRKLSEDGKRAKQGKAEKGERLGGRRLYGYTTGAVPTIIEHEAERIRSAARAVLEGRSLSSIVRQWNEEGVTTSTGSKWSQPTLSQMLKNRAYNGRTTLRNDDAGPGNWEAILDDETYAAVGAIMADPSRRPKHIGAGYPLVGLLRCHCGKQLGSTSTRKGDQRIRRYGCRSGLHGNNINADIAEQRVWDVLLPLADMSASGRSSVTLKVTRTRKLQQLRVAIAEAKAKKAQLAQAVSEGVFTLDDIRKPSAELRSPSLSMRRSCPPWPVGAHWTSSPGAS